MHEDVQFSGNIYAYLKFTVYGHKQTYMYTRVLQCSPASVGLAQARPNKLIIGCQCRQKMGNFMDSDAFRQSSTPPLTAIGGLIATVESVSDTGKGRSLYVAICSQLWQTSERVAFSFTTLSISLKMVVNTSC